MVLFLEIKGYMIIAFISCDYVVVVRVWVWVLSSEAQKTGSEGVRLKQAPNV